MEHAERERIACEIRRLVKVFGSHPWDINNGQCEEFADALLEYLGSEAESHWLMNVDEEAEDIAHAVVVYKGYYFDAEEPYGVRDWRFLPLCARHLREAA